MTTDDIAYERHGQRAEIVLSRPDKRNAMTEAMWQALPGLCARAEADREVLALVLRGASGQAFSGGADIAEFGEVYGSPERTARYNEGVERATDALAGLSKPTIAVIEGACFGGGCSLALACDLRFAADTARFAITPARLGIAYSFAATRRLVNAVGTPRAKDILFSGRVLDAGEALAVGLCDRVLPENELAGAVAAYVAGLASVSQYTVRVMKRTVDTIAAGAAEPNAQLLADFDASFAGEDFAEGRAAFLAKRSPRFTWR